MARFQAARDTTAEPERLCPQVVRSPSGSSAGTRTVGFMAKRSKKQARPWSARDSALWFTCSYVEATAEGRAVAPPSPVLTTFAPQGGADDVLLAQGPYDRFEFVAAGDGSYVQDTGFFMATGAVGLAATAALATARVIGNEARRSSANAAAMPRWTVTERGEITVGTRGFHLAHRHGVVHWPWQAIREVTMTGPGRFEMSGDSTQGPVRWCFGTPWAELVFALWALNRHPRHPQLLSGSWLPPGFLQWAEHNGYAAPLPGPAILMG